MLRACNYLAGQNAVTINSISNQAQGTVEPSRSAIFINTQGAIFTSPAKISKRKGVEFDSRGVFCMQELVYIHIGGMGLSQ